MQSKTAIHITIQQQIIAVISTRAKALGYTEKDLITGIMNSTTWWRIRNNKSDLTFTDAIKLLDRIGIHWTAYLPEQVLASHAILTQA